MKNTVHTIHARISEIGVEATPSRVNALLDHVANKRGFAKAIDEMTDAEVFEVTRLPRKPKKTKAAVASSTPTETAATKPDAAVTKPGTSPDTTK